MKKLKYALIPLFGILLCGIWFVAPYLESSINKIESVLGTAIPEDATEIQSTYRHGFLGDDAFYIRFVVSPESFSRFVDAICENGEQSLSQEYGANTHYFQASTPEWWLPDSEEIILGGVCYQNVYVEIFVTETDQANGYYTAYLWGGTT